MPKVHDQTVAVRLPAKLYRRVLKEQEQGETLSATLRRILTMFFAEQAA